MNGLVSFFRDRKRGTTYELTWRVSPAPTFSVFVYCLRLFESPALKDRELAEKECASAFQEIRSDVGHSGGGGVIVTAAGEVQRLVKVEAVAGSEYQPPGHFIVLAPGASPRF